MSTYAEKSRESVQFVDCPLCGASRGDKCFSLRDGVSRIKAVHGARYFAAYPDERLPRYRFELFQDSLRVVTIDAGGPEEALAEVAHYTTLYAQEGPVSVKQTDGPFILGRLMPKAKTHPAPNESVGGPTVEQP